MVMMNEELRISSTRGYPMDGNTRMVIARMGIRHYTARPARCNGAEDGHGASANALWPWCIDKDKENAVACKNKATSMEREIWE